MSAKSGADGSRWVEVPPARLDRWLAGFAARHGTPITPADPAMPVDVAATGGAATPADPAAAADPDALLLRAPDGAAAALYPPPGIAVPTDVDALSAALRAPGPLGLVLARRGAVAVAVADGDALTRTKVDTRYVQGRTAAGGWSQQRFARRRANQTTAVVEAAVEVVARLLVPEAPRLAAVVCGGDRELLDRIMRDRRLTALAALRHPRRLDVPEPRHAVLVAALAAARAVRIRVTDPPPAPIGPEPSDDAPRPASADPAAPAGA
ncbi:acVLRF1 family peptidyl-tRNA hydrolase [Pilimelia anulata]|nr:acVLRF1 family peptidyl-tRNA hydrolase [Pilimelia anulata]